MAKKKTNNLPFEVDKKESSKVDKKPNPNLFTHGNTFWQNRDPDNVGRPKAIKSPDELWGYFVDYCQIVNDSPWIKHDFKGKDAVAVEIKLALPYTWYGFDNYLFSQKIIDNLDDYKANKKKKYSDFCSIIARIDKVIFDRKYNGASVNAFNASIIARDLKLVDASDITTGGKKLGSSPSKIEVQIVRAKDEDE
jgi:hypothetical protein